MLRLFRLSFGIGSVEIQYTLSCGDKRISNKAFVSYQDTDGWNKLKFGIDAWFLKNCDEFVVCVDIEILHAYSGTLLDPIDVKEWSKYGIIHNGSNIKHELPDNDWDWAV